MRQIIEHPFCICASAGPAAQSAGAAAYRITDLGTLGGSFSSANAISDKGQIAGYGVNRNAETRAVLLTPTGQQRPACTRPDADPTQPSIGCSGVASVSW